MPKVTDATYADILNNHVRPENELPAKNRPVSWIQDGEWHSVDIRTFVNNLRARGRQRPPEPALEEAFRKRGDHFYFDERKGLYRLEYSGKRMEWTDGHYAAALRARDKGANLSQHYDPVPVTLDNRMRVGVPLGKFLYQVGREGRKTAPEPVLVEALAIHNLRMEPDSKGVWRLSLLQAQAASSASGYGRVAAGSEQYAPSAGQFGEAEPSTAYPGWEAGAHPAQGEAQAPSPQPAVWDQNLEQGDSAPDYGTVYWNQYTGQEDSPHHYGAQRPPYSSQNSQDYGNAQYTQSPQSPAAGGPLPGVAYSSYQLPAGFDTAPDSAYAEFLNNSATGQASASHYRSTALSSESQAGSSHHRNEPFKPSSGRKKKSRRR